MQERRKQVRKEVAAGQGLTFFVPGDGERHLGIIDDICDDGLGIAVEGCFTPGTMLEIVIEEDEQETYLVGEVRWCEPDEWLEGSYHLGVATRARMVT